MKSYSTLRTQYGRLTKNQSSANLTVGDELINDDHREICSMQDWGFLHKLRTITTVASQQAYVFPYDVDQVESVFVTVSGTRYIPKIIHSREQWDQLNRTSYTSDFPQFAHIYNGQVSLYPTPSSSSNTISLNAKLRVVDLKSADYVTGTVDIITNGDETTTGSGTTWTSPMTGRWLRITQTDAVATSGDGHWYEIDSITSTTILETVRAYGGTSLTTGASAGYIIGQMPLLPENFHDMIVYGAASVYWYNNEDTIRGDRYAAIRERKLHNLVTQYSSETTDPILDEGEERPILNSNLTVEY